MQRRSFLKIISTVPFAATALATTTSAPPSSPVSKARLGQTRHTDYAAFQFVRADGPVTKGEIVMWAGAPYTVTAMQKAPTSPFAGIAEQDIRPGGKGLIRVSGYATTIHRHPVSI